MKKRYLIVKYVSEYNEIDNKWVYIFRTTHLYTPTAYKAGIPENYFTDVEKAKKALDKMKKLNPTVDYGIIEVKSWWESFINSLKNILRGNLN